MKLVTLRRLVVIPVVVFAVQALAPSALASHSWAGYHWARTANPFTLKLGDNLSSSWKPYLATTSADWSESAVLDTTVVPGSTSGRKCAAATGRVQVCSDRYGSNGWLGIATVWVNGAHITKGAVKMNDTYFNKSAYNTPAWRNLVLCQEVGHTLGLDHQDENFGNPNLGTCTDYTSNPETNQHPNDHDYAQLATVYSHLDTTTTIDGSPTSAQGSSGDRRQDDWGRAIRTGPDGRPVLFRRDLATGETQFTWVVWA
ncbi:MAG: hypothetical protein ACRD1K_10375 [Acidimicrobiales bacterium]